MLSFSISYPDLIKFLHFFMDTLKGGFEGERRPKDKVTLWITLVYIYTCMWLCKCVWQIFTLEGLIVLYFFQGFPFRRFFLFLQGNNCWYHYNWGLVLINSEEGQLRKKERKNLTSLGWIFLRIEGNCPKHLGCPQYLHKPLKGLTIVVECCQIFEIFRLRLLDSIFWKN